MAQETTQSDPNADQPDPFILTLSEWREIQSSDKVRTVWNPLEPFFEKHGYRLWELKPATYPCVMGHVYETQSYAPQPGMYVLSDDKYEYLDMHIDAPVNAYATAQDGRWVVIRLIAKGDQGVDELAALRRVASGPVALDPSNHTLPMIQELCLDDMTFGVFPRMADFRNERVANAGEMLSFAHQILEGVAFLHAKLVTHHDLDIPNILVNYAHVVPDDCTPGPPKMFYSRFPARLYFIDFELAYCFPFDSKPEDRLVTGFPFKRREPDITLAGLGRPMAPEMSLTDPYDPFVAEVYQVGAVLCLYKTLAPDVPEFGKLLDEMISKRPQDRPSIAEALERVDKIRATLDPAIALKYYEQGQVALDQVQIDALAAC